jgi:hypothetical protein
LTYNKILLIAAFLSLTMLYSCSDSPTSIGINLLSTDYLTVNKIDSYQDSLGQSSSYYKTSIRLSDSPRLLVGKYQNVEASSLIRFAVVLPDTIKNAFNNSTLNILSAKVYLTKLYNIGDESANLSYSAHFVTSGWTSFGFTADSLPNLQYNNNDISSNKTYSDTLYTFDIDNPTINSWFASASLSPIENNKGMYLKPDPASTRVVGFEAYNSVEFTGIPKLTVIAQTGSLIDTLNFYSIEDVSAISGDKPDVPAGDIAVQGGLAVNSRVKYDLSSVPEGAVINKAQFTIYVDSNATKTGDNFNNSLVIYFARDSVETSYDTTSVITLNRSGDTFTGDIAKFIQSIVSRYHDNNGFVLAAGSQNLGIDIFALKGSDASEASLRPRLVITYTGKK